MARHAYSTRYDPPAAVVPLEIQHPHGSAVVLLPALVDTGADVTVLPVSLAAQLRLPSVGRAVVSGLDGLARIVQICAAHVRCAGLTLIVEAAVYGREALAGRDLLNRLVVRLDGPGAVLDVRVRRRP